MFKDKLNLVPLTIQVTPTFLMLIQRAKETANVDANILQAVSQILPFYLTACLTVQNLDEYSNKELTSENLEEMFNAEITQLQEAINEYSKTHGSR